MEIQTTNAPRLNHHHLRRLDKAAKHAMALERINVRADEHTALNVTAYAGYMQGIVALERELWDIALSHLAKIYSKLGGISSTETNQLCKEKVDEIDHRIRFCLQNLRKASGQGRAPEIKDEETKDLIAKLLKGHEDLTSKLESVVNDATKKPGPIAGTDQHEVSWKGQRVGIQNEKLRAILLVNALKLVRELEADSNATPETKLPLFEQLFGAYADATKLIKEETTAIQKNNVGKGKAKDPQEQTLNLLQEYVTCLKLQASIQRSVFLGDSAYTAAVTDITPGPTIKKKHPDEMVRLYDSVISGMREIESLTQGTAQDPEETKVIAAKLILYKALRCYWLAQSYVVIQNSEKALALFNRASQHSTQAATSFASASRASSADRERLARLDKEITSSRAKARARAFLSTVETESKQPKSSSMVAGLNSYDSSFLADKRLTDFPPNLDAIPCKPLLFDLALNDCTFPNLDARKRPQSQKPEKTEQTEKSEKSGGGFFNFWRK